MLTPLYVAVFSLVCALGAYGVQRRKKWAWYGGWIVMFFTAGALGVPLVFAALSADAPLLRVVATIGLIGAVLLWTGWAIWWSRRQREFGVDPTRSSVAN